MDIEFMTTVAVIAPEPSVSRGLYVDALGLPLESGGGEYHHSEQIAGCKSVGIWPLSQAAEACFGTAESPVPQVSIEFDVADVAAVGSAARELQRAGYELLHPPRTEPWGQTVARLQTPEGAMLGISTPPFSTNQHDLRQRRRAHAREPEPTTLRSPWVRAPHVSRSCGTPGAPSALGEPRCTQARGSGEIPRVGKAKA